MEDLRHGVNTQMLLYLYTLCCNGDRAFADQIGLEEGKMPRPAGVVYLSANIPTIDTEGYTTEEEMGSLAEKKLKRSGLLLDDEEILHDMNDALSPEILAGIKKDTKTELLKGRALTSSEQFESIFCDIRTTVLDIAKEMQSGRADAAPLIYGDLDPCAYCTSRSVCRMVKE